MKLPFTKAQFLGVFAAYNEAIWPAQIVFYALGIAFVILTLARRPPGGRPASLFLAAMWAWMGIGYHLLFFRAINPPALLFAVLFLLQAAAFTAHALARGGLPPRFTPGVRGIAGLALIGYSLVVYPLIGVLLGHGYPACPLFGVAPCPSAIFTFGLLLWSERKVPLYLIVLPFLWALIGSSAAVTLGIGEDIGLLVAGLGGTALLVGRRRRVPAAA